MRENVLVIGGGGREHAIARALADAEAELFACAENRNPGIARLASEFETLETTDTDAVVSYAETIDATIAVVGPEAPLEAGVVNELERAGIYAFGPRQADARIETDKSFQRRFMDEKGIPGCPAFETFVDDEAACAHIDAADGDLVIKPAGLTGGKGVKVIGDQVTAAEGKAYIRESNYDELVLEERLIGEEFTIQAFVANGSVETAPAVQDHKRAYEGDEGPNTGGMGSYSAASRELPFMTPEDYDEAVSIIEATVDALEGYKGILYGQFMLTAEGPKVVEFNARFGDPEAMNTLPVMETSVLDVLVAARDGKPIPELSFAETATVCKYAVPEGYPTDPKAGVRVAIDDERAGEALLFYASVDEREDGIYTTTSRSFAVVGRGESITEAEQQAEAAITEAGEKGLHVRHDIGKPDLVQRRIDHMESIRG